MGNKKKILSSVLAMAMIFSLGVTNVSALELTPEKLADKDNLDTVAGTYNGEVYNKYSVDGSKGNITAGSASSVVVFTDSGRVGSSIVEAVILPISPDCP